MRSLEQLSEIVIYEFPGSSLLLDAVEEVEDYWGLDKLDGLLQLRDECTLPFRRLSMESEKTESGLSLQDRLDTLQELMQELSPDEVDMLIVKHQDEITKLKRLKVMLGGRRKQALGRIGEQVVQLFKSTGNKPLHVEQIALKIDSKANKVQMAINKSRGLFVKNSDGWKLKDVA